MLSLLLNVLFMDEFIEVKLIRPIFNSTINAHVTFFERVARKMCFFDI